MRLALHTDYGLRVLMYLTGYAQRSTIGEIAAFFEISKDHVAKVVQRLSKLGYLRSVRGIGGGLELARSPDRIRLGEVILQLEGNMHLLECVSAEEEVCVIQQGCKLKQVLDRAEKVQMQYLNGVRLSDVVQPGRELVTLKSDFR